MDLDVEVETTEEAYVYLDFGDKVKHDLFQKDIFLRLANLETETPLVQLNDVLFKGEYKDCVGTNLFFEDVEDPEPRDLCEGDGSIRLKHTITQHKVLALSSVQIPAKWKDMPQSEYDIKIINCDYETLLKKFTDGTLSLAEDFIKIPKVAKEKTKEVNPLEIYYSELSEEPNVLEINDENCDMEVVCPEVVDERKGKKEKNSSQKNLKVVQNFENVDIDENLKIELVDIISYKYEKLKRLAMRPTRRKIQLDLIEPCDPEYQMAYEYNSIKCQVMMPSDYFRTISKEYNRDTLVGIVDIDRSVAQGIIKPSSDFCRILTEDEKAALLSMENLENLSMLGRYWVLKAQLEHFQNAKLTIPEAELLKVDKYGRTIEENISVYKRLVRVVNGILEANYCYDSDQETIDEESSDNSSLKEGDALELDNLSEDSGGPNCTVQSEICGMKSDTSLKNDNFV